MKFLILRFGILGGAFYFLFFLVARCFTEFFIIVGLSRKVGTSRANFVGHCATYLTEFHGAFSRCFTEFFFYCGTFPKGRDKSCKLCGTLCYLSHRVSRCFFTVFHRVFFIVGLCGTLCYLSHRFFISNYPNTILQLL